MTSTQDVLANVDRAKLKEFLTEIDGHDLIGPEFFTDMGFSPEFVEKYTTVHKSGKHPKEWIFDSTGQKVESMKAVFDLSFVRGLAEEIGADTETAGRLMGRGFAARAYAAAVIKTLGL